MIETDVIELDKGAAMGVKIPLQKGILMVAITEKGYLCCSYFNPETIERLEDCAAIVSGVRTFEQMLKAKVDYASKKAKKLGIVKGMTGKDALEKMV